MFNQMIRENKVVSALLAILRIYLGYAWFTAGLHKFMGGFDASGFLQGAISHPVTGPDGIVYQWYVDFLQHVALAHVDVFNILVPTGELLIGLGLILGCFTTAAAFFALVMNFSFLLAGTVSHNPTDILMAGIILVSGINAGRYGLDRFVSPTIRKIKKQKEVQ